MTKQVTDVQLIKALYPSGNVDFTRLKDDLDAARRVSKLFTSVVEVTSTTLVNKRKRTRTVHAYPAKDRAHELYDVLKNKKAVGIGKLCTKLRSDHQSVLTMIDVLRSVGCTIVEKRGTGPGRHGTRTFQLVKVK